MDNDLIEHLMSVVKMDRGAAEAWADDHCEGWRTEPRNEPVRCLSEGAGDE
ncbi:hypothetical protein [Photobacterium atrarenae]|uniref:Uncharacterized protein n=1 Tax=Photobacterium atrarenae TaxID=865757 RepID=A0ABY5GLJ1_9GAMM|nr:hypothetical protein [Photobacterium atrarenae]UTV30187.1 hypothetical protein NNL38_16505 [Photobacterium atrarenae]